jgi:hypothetical protein
VSRGRELDRTRLRIKNPGVVLCLCAGTPPPIDSSRVCRGRGAPCAVFGGSLTASSTTTSNRMPVRVLLSGFVREIRDYSRCTRPSGLIIRAPPDAVTAFVAAAPVALRSAGLGSASDGGRPGSRAGSTGRLEFPAGRGVT